MKLFLSILGLALIQLSFSQTVKTTDEVESYINLFAQKFAKSEFELKKTTESNIKEFFSNARDESTASGYMVTLTSMEITSQYKCYSNLDKLTSVVVNIRFDLKKRKADNLISMLKKTLGEPSSSDSGSDGYFYYGWKLSTGTFYFSYLDPEVKPGVFRIDIK